MFSISIILKSFIASAVLPLLAAGLITLYALMFQPHKSTQASIIVLNYWVAFLLFSALTIINNALTYRLLCRIRRVNFFSYITVAGFLYGGFFTYLAWDKNLNLARAFFVLGIYGVVLGCSSAALYHTVLIKGVKKNKHPHPGLLSNALLFTALFTLVCKLMIAHFKPESGLGSYLGLKSKLSFASLIREVPPGKILISSNTSPYPGQAYFDFLFEWWWLFSVALILAFVYTLANRSN